MVWLRNIDRWFMDEILPYAGVYRSYARRLVRDAEEAEDLVQDAYARILSLRDWQRLDVPHRFALRVIHNLAVERIRHARVVRIQLLGGIEAMECHADSAPDPYDVLASRQELSRLIDALNRLPEKCREVTVLRKIDGLSPFQIAERMAISVSTVEKHLTKGLRQLTEFLAEEDCRAAESSAGIWQQSEKTGTPG